MGIGYKGGKFYEIFVDNTILFLEEIDRNKDVYTSIFDSPILNSFKVIHDQYGTVWTFCIFYEIDQGCVNMIPNASDRTGRRVGWNISQMTDKFKAEFEANSDWLRFNYHCWNHSTMLANTERDLGADYAATRTEVRRFAGEKSWIDFRSKMHNYSATLLQQQQIRAQGVKVVVFSPQHTQYNGYGCTIEQRDAIWGKGELYRADTGLLYSTSTARVENIVLNMEGDGYTLGVGVPMDMYTYLDEYVSGVHDTWKKPFGFDYMSIETHEYCYWWEPPTKTASVSQGFFDTARWMQDHGYRPGFYDYHIDNGLRYKWVNPKFA